MSHNKTKWGIVNIFFAIVVMFIIAFGLIELESNNSLRFLFNYPKPLVSLIDSFIIILSGTLFLVFRYSINFFDFGFGKTNFKKTIIWGVIGGIIVSFIEFPYKIIIGKKEIPFEIYLSIDSEIYYIIIFLFIVVIIIPFVEEIFIRAYVFGIIKNRFNVFWGYVVSTLLFTFLHTFSSLGSFFSCVASSLILTFLYEKTRLLGPSIIAHGLLNLSWYASVYIFELSR